MCVPHQGFAGAAVEFMDGIPIQVDILIETFRKACHEVADATRISGYINTALGGFLSIIRRSKDR
jgi:hypothetical protein